MPTQRVGQYWSVLPTGLAIDGAEPEGIRCDRVQQIERSMHDGPSSGLITCDQLGPQGRCAHLTRLQCR